MSELSSLFVKLTIQKENLDRFLNAPITTPVLDEDWNSWWDQLEMYSKSSLESLPVASGRNNGEVFSSLVNSMQTGSLEKQEAGVYYFISSFFSENYYEILPMLAVLKSIAQYMGPDDHGEAFIYDFFWGGDAVMAHLELNAGHAVLKHTKHTNEIDKQLLTEANTLLQGVMDELSDKYED